MITNLRAEHFKSLARVDVHFGQITVLAGKNSSGKSNVIDCLKFIKDAVEYDLDRAISGRHGIERIQQWAPTRPYNVTIEIEVANEEGKGRYLINLGSSKGQYLILKEEGYWEGTNTFYPWEEEFEELATGENESEIETNTEMTFERRQDGSITYERRINSPHKIIHQKRDDKVSDINDLVLSRMGDFYYIASDARKIRRAIIDFEAYSIFPNTLRTPQTISNERQLSANGGNLTSIYKYMTRTAKGRAGRANIIEAMKLIIPQLDSISIQSLGGQMVPTFRIEEETSKDHDFNVSQVSDGTLRVFGLLVALYQPHRPAFIALEEPEQNIHPGILGLISDSIRDVSDDTQLLISTHSPDLLNYFDVKEIRVVQMTKEGTIVGEISKSQIKLIEKSLFTPGEVMASEGLRLKI